MSTKSDASDADRLSAKDRQRLERLEGELEQELTSGFRIGEILIEIRDSRLYRETHSSFEKYLEERWPSVPVRTAYNHMEAVAARQALPTLADQYSKCALIGPLLNTVDEAEWRQLAEQMEDLPVVACRELKQQFNRRRYRKPKTPPERQLSMLPPEANPSSNWTASGAGDEEVAHEGKAGPADRTVAEDPYALYNTLVSSLRGRKRGRRAWVSRLADAAGSFAHEMRAMTEARVSELTEDDESALRQVCEGAHRELERILTLLRTTA